MKAAAVHIWKTHNQPTKCANSGPRPSTLKVSWVALRTTTSRVTASTARLWKRAPEWLIMIRTLRWFTPHKTHQQRWRVTLRWKVQVYKWFIRFGMHLIGVIDLKDANSVWHISLNVKWAFVSWFQQDFSVAFPHQASEQFSSVTS